MRFILWPLYWFVYVPLIRVIVLFLFWNNKMEARERFEKKNKFEYLAQSFHEIGITADLCFEFSSEGEYQQIAPLIDDALKANKRIELVFFSPSVEKTIMKLASLYPTQIRYMRYPFARVLPFVRRRSIIHWVTSKTLVMVRYDLFPELLLWALTPGNKLKMVWMTFKKEQEAGGGPSFWKKLFIKASKDVVYAREVDRNIVGSGVTFDFRIEQIRRRLEKRAEKFQQQFPLYLEFKKHLDSQKQTVIIGNAWPSDLFLLKNLSPETYIVIVPHDLSEANLQKFREQLSRPFFEINDQTKALAPHKTLLINKKGILCELYADFSHAYVGGGFEASIHSVLEPLVGGSGLLACGPKHYRSTEYDLAKAMQKITELNTPEQFEEWLNAPAKIQDHDRIKALVNGYDKAREIVFSC